MIDTLEYSHEFGKGQQKTEGCKEKKRKKKEIKLEFWTSIFTNKIEFKLNLLIIFIKKVIFEAGKIMILWCRITAVQCHSLILKIK